MRNHSWKHISEWLEIPEEILKCKSISGNLEVLKDSAHRERDTAIILLFIYWKQSFSSTVKIIHICLHLHH